MPDTPPGPLVPRPVIIIIALVLLACLPLVIALDAIIKDYDGTIAMLTIGALLAGICGFELIVGFVRSKRDDL